MEYKYEAALSYAHADKEVAEQIAEELRNIFADKFFMDCYHQYELTNAEQFEQQLQRIFSVSHYSIILYSDNYKKGRFTNVELEGIIHQTKKEKKNNFFIINITGRDIEQEALENLTYIGLKVSENEKKAEEEKIYNIICDIKKFIMHQTLKEKKQEKEYAINIHTLFMPGNDALWKTQFDWNLLASKYIDEEDKRIRDGYTWKDLWNYIKKDYILIKNELKKEADIFCKIHLNCHLSIAYKLGQVYGDLNQASGNRNLILVSSNSLTESEFRFEKEREKKKIEDFCREYTGSDRDSSDIACIISIKPTAKEYIVETVKNGLEQIGQKCSKLFLFQQKIIIENTNDLEDMADYLFDRMQECRNIKKNSTIHLFLDTLAPLAFVLGGRSIFPGEVKLYEYIVAENTYETSLTKNMK